MSLQAVLAATIVLLLSLPVSSATKDDQPPQTSYQISLFDRVAIDAKQSSASATNGLQAAMDQSGESRRDDFMHKIELQIFGMPSITAVHLRPT